MITNHVQYGHARSRCVVKVGDAIRITRSKVQQRECRRVGHARKPIGRTRDDAFKQAKHGPYSGFLIERCDELHLRSARIGEACTDTSVCELLYE